MAICNNIKDNCQHMDIASGVLMEPKEKEIVGGWITLLDTNNRLLKFNLNSGHFRSYNAPPKICNFLNQLSDFLPQEAKIILGKNPDLKILSKYDTPNEQFLEITIKYPDSKKTYKRKASIFHFDKHVVEKNNDIKAFKVKESSLTPEEEGTLVKITECEGKIKGEDLLINVPIPASNLYRHK